MQKRLFFLYSKYKRLFFTYFNVWRSKIHFVSYPKSGRTWLRMLIGHYLQNAYKLELDIKDLSLIQELNKKSLSLPSISMTHWNDPQLRRYSDVRLLPTVFRSRPLVFLIRNPFDVAKSYFYQFHFRGENKQVLNPSNYSSEIGDFIFGDYGGIKNVIEYHRQIDKIIKSYKGKVFILKYEDLVEDTFGYLKSLLVFLEFHIDDNMIMDSVDFCSKTNLKNLEEKGMLNDFHFGGDGKAAKVRSEQKREMDKIRILHSFYKERFAHLDPFYSNYVNTLYE